jgi:hypothetical protein
LFVVLSRFNFPEPVALHDYRYLGEDFRQRERIKRKKQRWVIWPHQHGRLTPERRVAVSRGEPFNSKE